MQIDQRLAYLILINRAHPTASFHTLRIVDTQKGVALAAVVVARAAAIHAIGHKAGADTPPTELAIELEFDPRF